MLITFIVLLKINLILYFIFLSYNYKTIIIKIFTLFFLLLISFVGFSQKTQGYYVVAKENHSIEPTQKTQTPNGELTLSFQNTQLQTFFNNKLVYKYEKAFPTAETPLLQRTYEVNLVGENHL